MLTKLGKASLGIIAASSSSTRCNALMFNTSASGNKCSKKCKDYTGTEKYLSMLPFSTAITPIVSTITGDSKGIAFGSGTTPATEDDYTIENLIRSGISVTYAPSDGFGSYFYDSEANSEDVYITFTITNTGSSSISISEICRFATFSLGSDYGAAVGTGASYRSAFLIDRTVLDTPVVIEAGSSGVIRYQMAFAGDAVA